MVTPPLMVTDPPKGTRSLTMKSLIVYYSFSSNTQKVAQVLKEVLSRKGETDLVGLKPEDESDNFFIQVVRALTKKRALLKEAPLDVAGYDLVCIGTPVWAFAPAPAVNSYIDGLKNIEGRDAICFITYGSGIGTGRCLNTMKMALKEKGAFKLSSFKIQESEVNDEDFVKEAIMRVI